MANLSALFGSPDAWAQYRAKAQQGTQGIGNIPFVFSNYAGIPSDPAAAMAMFYQQAKPAAQAAQNPLLQQPVQPKGAYYYGKHGYGAPGNENLAAIDVLLGRAKPK